MKFVECVPNFSEGRDKTIIKRITDQIESVSGVQLLDVDPGESTNRTVVTFIGDPEAVCEAAFRAVKQAAGLIDMAKHHGEHARMGATDVVPFIPVSGLSMDDCVQLARRVGQRIGEELGIPVYLYEHAATKPERKNLATIRAGEYEGLPKKISDPAWKPDFGPAAFHSKSGATAVGAREFLIAYNVNLNTSDRRYATDIAYELRERGRWKRTGNVSPFYYKGEVVNFALGRFLCGNCEYVARNLDELASHYKQAHGGDLYGRYKSLGMDVNHLEGSPVYADGRFTHVKAVGWVVEAYQRAQISINLTNYRITPAHVVLEEARKLAQARGIVITGSEIVGVVPFEAMLASGKFYLRRMHKSTGIPVRDTLETAVQSMGLRDVAEFDIDKKIIGIPKRSGPLARKTVVDFVDEVSRDTPAPGGGSIAALAGALGAALASMVANLSIGKGKFDPKYEEICEIAEQAQQIKDELLVAIDEDTEAFNVVLNAMRLPKDTPQQQSRRQAALSEGYKSAAKVPLRTAELCLKALRLSLAAGRIGNESVMSDAGVGALMAYAGVQGALYNVRINLPKTDDPMFVTEMKRGMAELLGDSRQICEAVQQAVEASLEKQTAETEE